MFGVGFMGVREGLEMKNEEESLKTHGGDAGAAHLQSPPGQSLSVRIWRAAPLRAPESPGDPISPSFRTSS